jgi:hypothetical protein
MYIYAHDHIITVSYTDKDDVQSIGYENKIDDLDEHEPGTSNIYFNI